jgi:hypothetical protein
MNKQENEQKINEIQQQIVPRWTKLLPEEQSIVSDLYYKWDLSVISNFNRLSKRQKRIINIAINEEKLIQKGPFDFDSNISIITKMQKEFIQNKPNTRLLIKSFRKFIETFETLSKCKQSIIDETDSSYWFHLNKALSHLKIGILRMAFYVHEIGDLSKASIGLPPIYAIESDDCDNPQIPQVKLETLYQYIYLCANFLRIKIAIDKNKSAQTKKCSHDLKMDERSKYLKLMIKCLIHLMQISFRIRDDLITKTISYPKDFNSNKTVDIDIYSNYIQNEFHLINDYLKQI